MVREVKSMTTYPNWLKMFKIKSVIKVILLQRGH